MLKKEFEIISYKVLIQSLYLSTNLSTNANKSIQT